MRTRTLITAHAGAEQTPPNSLDSLRVLLRCGADFVELDLRGETGRLILAHDRLEQGKEYSPLEDAFTLFAQHPGPRMNLDVKEPGLIPNAWEMAGEFGLQARIVFTGDAGAEDLRFVRERGAELWLNYYLLPMKDWPRAHETAVAHGFPALNIDQRRVTARMLEEAPRRLSVWTVNEEQKLRALLLAGVLNITTKTPLLALRLRKEIQRS